MAHDETVKKHIQAYLTNLPTGKSDTKKAADAINSTIFLPIGPQTCKPISIRTVRRWLFKARVAAHNCQEGGLHGWPWRTDVVEYRIMSFCLQWPSSSSHGAV